MRAIRSQVGTAPAVALAGLGAVLVVGALPAAGPIALALLRLAAQACGIVVVGLLLILLLVRHGPARDAGAAPARLVGAAGLAWAGVCAVGSWAHVADATGVSPARVTTAQLVEYVSSLAHGRALVLTAACGSAVAVLGLTHAGRRVVHRAPELGIGVALLGLVAGPISGHSDEHEGHGAAVVLITVHVGAAAVWGGGLLALLLLAASRRELFDVVLPRFSVVAGWCLLAVTVGGLGSAALRVAPGALTSTGYGWLLLGKGLALIALAGLGWSARRAAARRAGRHPRLVRLLAVELAVMVAALGAAAVLALSTPPAT